MKTKIALCQLNSLSGNAENNLTVIEQVIRKHSRKGVKLFIFPEDFLFGILRKKPDILNAGKRFQFYLNEFSKLSNKYKVDLIPGSFPMLKNNKLYNTTVYIDRNGNVLNQYFKTNLWLSERDYFCPDKGKIKCFKSVLGNTVQIICWDIMDHNLFEEAVRQKSDWIIIPSFWTINRSSDLVKKRGETKNFYSIPINRSERLNSIIETRSTEYNIGIIFCNMGGVHSYLSSDNKVNLAISAGNSQIITPLDGVRKSIKKNKEQILIYDIPDIKNFISDHEILYGRREDIINNYV